MLTKRQFKNIAISFVLTIMATPVMGQDLLAKQAPIDRRMKAVDSMALKRLFQASRVMRIPQPTFIMTGTTVMPTRLPFFQTLSALTFVTSACRLPVVC